MRYIFGACILLVGFTSYMVSAACVSHIPALPRNAKPVTVFSTDTFDAKPVTVTGVVLEAELVQSSGTVMERPSRNQFYTVLCRPVWRIRR